MVGAQPERSRLDSLTVVRFFAAIYVVLYHFSGPVILFWNRIGNGYLGVDLFFVLSGFILMYNYGDKATAQATFYRRFLHARIARIYPAFFLAFVLCTPVVMRAALSRHSPVEAWTKTAIAGVATLSLVHAWSPRMAFFWNFPSWSVSHEMFFYLCFPVLAVPMKRFSAHRNLLVAGACLLLAPKLLSLALAKSGLLPANIPTPLLEFIPIVRLSQFIMGMAVGRIFLLRQHRPRLGRTWRILAIALSLCLAATLPSLPLLLRIFLPTPIFALLIYTLARCERPPAEEKRFAMRGLVLLGDASYSIYILQWPLFCLCGLSLATLTPPQLVSYLLLLLGASIASLKLVEEPLRLRILRVLGSSRVPQAALTSVITVPDSIDMPTSQGPALETNT